MADPVVADYYLGATPASPAALAGDRAPVMLGYLPTYYVASTHVRELLQVEGYEADYMRYLAEEVIPTLTRPADCPEWALAMWEAVLRLPGRSTWAAADRRASIEARVGQVITETELKNFLAVEARVNPADITFDIRPSVAFEPEDIAGVVEAWVADDLAQGDGTAVTSWVGRVAASNLAQATGGKKPLYRVAGIGGSPAVDFDGADDVLRYAGTLSTAASGRIFMVVLHDSLAATSAAWSSCDEATDNYYFFGALSATPKLYVQQSNNDVSDQVEGSTTTVLVSTPYLYEWGSTSAAYELEVNAVAQGLTVVSGANTGDWFSDTPNRDSFVVGALKRTAEVGFFNGKVAAVIVVDGALSSGDRDSLNGWVNSKYGLSLPVPGAVPNHKVDIQTTGMTAGEEEAVRAASRLAFAAHLALYLNGVAFTP